MSVSSVGSTPVPLQQPIAALVNAEKAVQASVDTILKTLTDGAVAATPSSTGGNIDIKV